MKFEKRISSVVKSGAAVFVGAFALFLLFLGCSAHLASFQYETTNVVFSKKPLYKTMRMEAELDSMIREEFGLSWKSFKKAYCKYGDPLGPASFAETARKVALIATIADSLNRYCLPFSLRVNEVRILHGADNIYHTQHYSGKISIPIGVFLYYPEEYAIRSLYHEFGHAFYWALSYEKIHDLFNFYIRSLEKPGFLSLFKDSNYQGNRIHDGHPEDSAGELFASAFSIVNLNNDEFREKIQQLPLEEYRLALQIEELIKTISATSQYRLAKY